MPEGAFRAAGWRTRRSVSCSGHDGDAEAFGQLVRAYSRRVVGYFCRQIGDRAEAEDLAQDVFLRLYRSRARYQPKARFGTWVFHIMQNVARNAMRYRRRHPVVRLTPASEGGGEAFLFDPARRSHAAP